MEKSWKSVLQEYCQKNKLPSPNYRIRQEAGLSNHRRYQMEVEINGRWYISKKNCISKKEAEHSAAECAYNDLMRDSVNMDHQESLPADPVGNENDSTNHFPPEYEDIENYIVTMVTAFGGRIRKVQPSNARGMIRVEIGGRYRYCHRINRHHHKNQVYLLVDPKNKIYYQKCHDPDCRGFQSSQLSIYTNSTINI